MTHSARHQTSAGLSDAVRHRWTIPLTVLGSMVAALGTWMALGPGDATINVFSWTWKVADLSELWSSWLMIGGGFLAAISAGWEANRTGGDAPGLRVLEGLIVLGGVLAMAVGLLLLF